SPSLARRVRVSRLQGAVTSARGGNMKFQRPATAYLVFGAAVLAGCRSSGDVEGLIREHQQREEFATELQVQLDQCCRELRATRDLLAAKEQQPATGGSRKTMGD